EDLFAAKPGEELADHARGDLELRRELAGIFRQRTTEEWVQFGLTHDVPIGPVNTPETVARDPQFLDRMPWQPAAVLVADQLPFPVRVVGEAPPAATTPAPTLDEHRDAIVRDILS